MENKKMCLAIVITIVLILLLLFYSLRKSTLLPNVVVPNNINIQAEDVNNEQVQGDIIFEKEDKKVLDIININLNKKSSKKEASVVKNLNINETKKENKKTSDNNLKLDSGISLDLSTNDVVVTKEFKIKTPSKYTFVGYGEQLAPIK